MLQVTANTSSKCFAETLSLPPCAIWPLYKSKMVGFFFFFLSLQPTNYVNM